MKTYIFPILYISSLFIAGSAYADGLSKKVVIMNSLSDNGSQQVKFRDKEGACEYSGEALVKQQSPSLMRVFTATEKTMLISISSKSCNKQVSSVKLYASPDQERLNKSISVFGASNKILIPQGSEFYLTEGKKELSWYVKN